MFLPSVGEFSFSVFPPPFLRASFPSSLKCVTWLVLLFSHYVLCPLMFHSNVTTSPRRLQRRLLPFLSLFHLCLLHLPLLLISSFSPATQLTKHTVLSLQQRNGKPQSQLVLSNETDVNRPPIHNHVIYLRQREKKVSGVR